MVSKNDTLKNKISECLNNPVKFLKLCWPDIKLYDKQVEILQSVALNDVTVVPAGNMLGKDFIAGFIALWFFATRSPARVLTSSVDGSQLEGVLWGEIRNFLQTSKYKLPFKINHLHLRQIINGKVASKSELIGRVAKKSEGVLGRHLKRDKARTLVIIDEASAFEDEYYEKMETWASRILIIGNPYPCENFFKRFVKAGDLPDKYNPGRYYRKVIKITAEDSPNVKRAKALQAKYKKYRDPKNRIELLQKSELLPGVLPYDEYQKRRETWDIPRQTVGLDAEFHEGADELLYPPQWLDRAEEISDQVDKMYPRDENFVPQGRIPKTLGIDPGEGSANTVWTLVDDLGIYLQIAKQTPDTSEIPDETIRIMQMYGIKEENVLSDLGGGGKHLADRLRKYGYHIRTIGFGEPANSLNIHRRMRTSQEKREDAKTRYTFKNRRAEMYGRFRYDFLDPVNWEIDDDGHRVSGGFGIPRQYYELRKELAPIPKLEDEEGRLYLPPKNKKTADSKTRTLIEIIGHSPDRADSLVLALYGLLVKPQRSIARAF